MPRPLNMLQADSDRCLIAPVTAESVFSLLQVPAVVSEQHACILCCYSAGPGLTVQRKQEPS
jgi:hypothetical protein